MDELIESLRNCVNEVDCSVCKYQYEGMVSTLYCKADMMREAADAIERLQRELLIVKAENEQLKLLMPGTMR